MGLQDKHSNYIKLKNLVGSQNDAKSDKKIVHIK